MVQADAPGSDVARQRPLSVSRVSPFPRRALGEAAGGGEGARGGAPYPDERIRDARFEDCGEHRCGGVAVTG